MVDLVSNPTDQFELSDLNPLKPEEGMNDPNRQSLLDTFGDEGLAAGMQQLVGMVTPQSFTQGMSMNQLMTDFVEFSPIGDVRDFLSAVNPNSGLDPLERGLAILPLVGWSAASVNVGVNLAQMRARTQANLALQNMASLQGERPAMPWRASMIYNEMNGIEVHEVTDPDYLPTESRAQLKARLAENKARRDALEGGRRWLATDSVGELAAVIGTEGFDGQRAAPMDSTSIYRLEESLNQIGLAVKEQTNGLFEDSDAGTLQAVQWSLWAYRGLIDGGLLYATEGTSGPVMYPATGRPNRLSRMSEIRGFEDRLLPQGDASGPRALKTTDLARLHFTIAGAASALFQANVGPDLKTTPQTRLGAVIVPLEGSDSTGPTSMVLGNPAGPNARVILFANDNLPDGKIVDGNGVLVDPELLDRRLRTTDYDTLEPEMAANIVKFMRQAEQEFTTADVQRGKNWYRRANATAVSLSQVSGIPVANVAAVFSGISMRNAWAPDNLVAATHAVLRFGGLDPASPEYRQAFIDAVNAGGWSHDLMVESSRDLQTRYKDNPAGLVEHYADINNFVASSGTSLRGMSLDTQQKNATMAGLLGLPPDLVIRMAKTNNFYAAILDPENTQVVAVDVHHNAGALGFDYGPEPLGSKGVRKLSYQEIADGSYQFPSGNRFTLEMVEQGEAALRDAGLSDAEIQHISNTWRTIPNEVANARYDAIARATHAAAMELGIEQTSSGQALAWEPIRQWRAGVQRHLYALRASGVDRNSVTYERALAESVHDRDVIDHLEGNPRWQKSIIGMTSNVSGDLSTSIPPGVLDDITPTDTRADHSGTPIIIEQRADGTQEVWADIQNPAVVRTLRHLRPVGMTAGGWTRMVPKEPLHTKSVADTGKRLVATPGESAEFRTIPSGLYVGDKPGNYVVMEVEDLETMNTLARDAGSLPHPVEITTQQVGMDPSQEAIVKVPYLKSKNPLDIENQKSSPFVTNDWVAISAAQNTEQSGLAGRTLERQNVQRHEELRTRLERAVVKHLGVARNSAGAYVTEVDGRYKGGGGEASFVVFGLPYDVAMEIGAEFNQESIATRNGMIYTTGENAGTYHPAADAGGWKFGQDAAEADFYSAVDTTGGPAVFAADYDWGETLPIVGSPNTLMGGHRPGGARYQVVVAMNGADGYAPSDLSQQLWDLGLNSNAQMTGYFHGDLHRPKSTTPVSETVYSDGVVTGVHRARYSSRNPHAVRAYVPTKQADHLTHAEAEYVGTRSKKEASRMLAEVFADGTPVDLGDGVTLLNWAVGMELTPKNIQRGIVHWEFKEDVDVQVYVDVNPDGSTTINFDLVEGTLDQIPGRVEVQPARSGEVSLRTSDPNLFAKAADAMALVGYKSVSHGNVVSPTKPTHQIKLDVPDIGPDGRIYQGTKSVQDIEQETLLQELHGYEYRFGSGGAVDLDTQNEVFRIIDGLMSPERAPASMKALHNRGLTLHPKLLSKEMLPAGITLGRGLPEGVHGVTVTELTWQDRAVFLNARSYRTSKDWGPEYQKVTSKRRAKKHFVKSDMNPMESIAVHEIGHAVLNVLDFKEAFFEAHFQRLKARLGMFGSTHNIGAYAFSSGHEFFAEAFVGMASGTKMDPRIEQSVTLVVELANHIAEVGIDNVDQSVITQAKNDLQDVLNS